MHTLRFFHRQHVAHALPRRRAGDGECGGRGHPGRAAHFSGPQQLEHAEARERGPARNHVYVVGERRRPPPPARPRHEVPHQARAGGVLHHGAQVAGPLGDQRQPFQPHHDQRIRLGGHPPMPVGLLRGLLGRRPGDGRHVSQKLAREAHGLGVHSAPQGHDPPEERSQGRGIRGEMQRHHGGRRVLHAEETGEIEEGVESVLLGGRQRVRLTRDVDHDQPGGVGRTRMVRAG